MAVGLEALTLFWAKRDRETGVCHPVLCHLLDIANVARLLWQDVFQSAFRHRLSAELGLDPVSRSGCLHTHARGGEPTDYIAHLTSEASSPRPWG